MPACRPHVDRLSFEERDDENWHLLRIRLPEDEFDDIDLDEIRSFALTRLEGVL